MRNRSAQNEVIFIEERMKGSAEEPSSGNLADFVGSRCIDWSSILAISAAKKIRATR
jgi:hypothetical protein